ncbi:hypothetical protein [Nocardia sp. NPDC003963]
MGTTVVGPDRVAGPAAGTPAQSNARTAVTRCRAWDLEVWPVSGW